MTSDLLACADCVTHEQRPLAQRKYNEQGEVE